MLGHICRANPIDLDHSRRFVDDAFGFALTWNYWLNDAVSTASDLVALQLVFAFWETNFPGWALSLIFWVILICANIITVAAYGEVRLFRPWSFVHKMLICLLARVLAQLAEGHYNLGELENLPYAY